MQSWQHLKTARRTWWISEKREGAFRTLVLRDAFTLRVQRSIVNFCSTLIRRLPHLPWTQGGNAFMNAAWNVSRCSGNADSHHLLSPRSPFPTPIIISFTSKSFLSDCVGLLVFGMSLTFAGFPPLPPSCSLIVRVIGSWQCLERLGWCLVIRVSCCQILNAVMSLRIRLIRRASMKLA